VSLFEKLLSRAKSTDHGFMVAVAVLIGCAGGLGAVGFRVLIATVKRVSWGDFAVPLDLVRSLPAWWVALVPGLGGLLVGPLVYFFAREARGHGVPEVMEAVALRAGAMRPRLVVVKSLASAITIGTGGSVGREGPIVQIGSAMGSAIGQWLRVSGGRLRTLVGCGAAAGIAATFNAPIAGALFAVEIILGDFAVTQFSPIVISSVVATVISRHFLGDSPAFDVPEHAMASAWELPLFALLGVVAAAVALAFVSVLYKLEDFFEALPIVPWLTAAIGGLAVGGIGVFHPEVFGIGYEGLEKALHGEMTAGVLVALLALKVLATGITIGSGGSGGVFAPSLFIGAMTGGALGTLVHQAFPEVTAPAGAYALVGMGAVVAGTTHGPITAILIIFELTSDYKLIVPLMTSCIIATLLATRWRRESIYTMKLIRRGIDIRRGQDINVLKSLHVRDVMDAGMVKVAADQPFGELIGEIAVHPHECFYVVDGGDRLKGVIVLSDLRSALEDAEAVADFLVAADLSREDFPGLSPDQDLDSVMKVFSGKNRGELPVVDEAGRIVGVVSRRHLLDAYNRELMKRDMASGLRGSLAATATEEVHLGEDYRMAEIDAPGEFAGRSIRDLDVRARYGAHILLLRRPSGTGGADSVEMAPEPDMVVDRGDQLVVVARARDLARLRAL
jgi:CIC family chloride channel protein